MRQSTIEERFRKLYLMQKLTKLLHPYKDSKRKIIIRNHTITKKNVPVNNNLYRSHNDKENNFDSLCF